MGLVAIALAGGMLLVVGAWSALGHHHSGVPVIEAQPGPVRVKPVDPGGMKLAGMDDLGSADGVDALAPPAETPAIAALAKQMHQAEAAPSTTPAAAAAAAAASGTDENEDVASPAPAGTPARQADAAALAASLPSPVAPAPVLAPSTPSAAPAAPPAASAVSTPPLPARPASVSATQVQLAAMDSEKAAFDEWARLDKRMPGLLASRKPVVEKAALAGRTIYRLRTGGFADIAAATGFCEQVRTKGGECSIAAF